MLWVIGVALGLVLIFFIISVIYKVVRLFFKVMGIIALVIAVIGIIFGVIAHNQSQDLKELLDDDIALTFTDDGSYVASFILSNQEEPQQVDTDSAQGLHDEYGFFSIAFPISELNQSRLTEAPDYLTDEQKYLFALGDELSGNNFVVLYFNETLSIAPEPSTFSFMRTQQFLPVKDLLEKRWFRGILGLQNEDS